MIKYKRLLTVLCSLFIGTTQLQAENQTISSAEFIQQIKNTHPLFAKEQLSATIKEAEQKSLTATKDWLLSNSLDFSHKEANKVEALAYPSKTENYSDTLMLQKTFWQTGSTLSLSLNAQSVDNTPTPIYFDHYNQNGATIAYSQPLFQNRTGVLNKFLYENKAYEIESAQVQSLENQESFIVSMSDKFLDWVSLEEQKKIVAERLNLSQEQLDTTNKKRTSNLVDQVDVIRASDAVISVKQNLKLTELQEKGLITELSIISKLSDLINFKPSFALYSLEKVTEQTHTENLEKIKNNSRIIQPIKLLKQQLDHTLTKYQEDLRANLSLVSSCTLSDADTTFSNSTDFDKPNLQVSLVYKLPWGQTDAKANIKKTRLQIEQIDKQIEESILSLTATLANLYIQITQLEEVLLLNQEQIKSAKEKTEEELKLYNQGRSQMNFVIQSRDNEQNAKLTYMQNAVMYHKLILRYKEMLDKLL